MRIRRSRSHEPDEKGSIIVELALVVPVLMIIILGLFEMGMAWNAKQTVVQAGRGGARTVTQLGQDNLADASALRSVAATVGEDTDRIIRVVVFEPDAAGNPPAVCNDEFVNNEAGAPCNVYYPADILQLGNDGHFDGNLASDLSCGGSSASSNWCPAARSDYQIDATFVGVMVVLEQDYFTGLFNRTTYRITESTIMRIEPEVQP